MEYIDYRPDLSVIPSGDAPEQLWQDLPSDTLLAAIDYLITKVRKIHPDKLFRTHRFGTTYSGYKYGELTWGQVTAKNLAAAVWADIWQDISTPKPTRRELNRIYHKRLGMRSAQGISPQTRNYRSRAGEFVRFLRNFLRLNKDTGWIQGNTERILGFAIWKYYNSREGFTDHDYRINSVTREGTFDLCAGAIRLWTDQVAYYDMQAKRAAKRVEQKRQQEALEATDGQHNGETLVFTDEQSAAADRPDNHHSAETLSELAADDRLAEPHLRVFWLLMDSYQTVRRYSEDRQVAGSQTFPSSRYKNKTFFQVNMHQIRRLNERLPELKAIIPAQAHVEVMIDAKVNPKNHPHPRSTVEKARRSRHLWQTHRRRRRALRAGHLEQSQRTVPAKTVELRELRLYELRRYLNQLSEMRLFREHVQEMKEHITVFLRGSPPSFPSARPILETGYDSRLQTYCTTLDWFTDAFPTSASPSRWHEYEPWKLEQVEAQARDAFLKALGDLTDTKLHPLIFKRSMSPGKGSRNKMASWALLYWEYTPTREELEKRYKRRMNFRRVKKSSAKQRYRPMSRSYREKKIARDLARGTTLRYALAVDIHAKCAFKDFGDGQPPREQRPRRIDSDDVAPHQRRVYRFVNAPHTVFAFPRRSSIMILPLEFTRDEDLDGTPHNNRLLDQIVTQQKQAQEHSYTNQYRWKPASRSCYRSQRRMLTRKPKTKQRRVCFEQKNARGRFFMKLKQLVEALPKPALSFAQIVSNVNAQGHRVFEVHASVESKVPPIAKPIRNVICFHKDGDSYCYAVITPEGTVIAVGDVLIPRHVRRRQGQHTYSDNFVYELVAAMVRLAKRYNAFIGLENTDYQREASGSRTENRERFAFPFEKIARELRDKALLAGLPAPHLTGGIPWKNACGQCGYELSPGTVNIYNAANSTCAACGTEQIQELVHIPILLHPVAIICHLPGISELLLSQKTLAGIFLGAIVQWNDEAITQDNPDVTLPQLRIQPVRRTDDAIVAATFNDYLGRIVQKHSTSDVWRDRLAKGQGTLQARRGDQQRCVAELVDQIEGAIGCVAWSPHNEEPATIIAIQNDAGSYVLPSSEGIDTTGLALAQEMNSTTPPAMTLLSSDRSAYPIVGVTWIRTHREWQNRSAAHELTTCVYWLLTQGRSLAENSGYNLIPDVVQQQALHLLQEVCVAGQPVFDLADAEDGQTSGAADEMSDDKAHTLVLTEVVKLTGVGAEDMLTVYQHWIEQYRQQAPHLNVVFQGRYDRDSEQRAARGNGDSEHANEQLVETVNDESEHKKDDQPIEPCTSCGGTKRQTDLWYDCIRCGTTMVARYNIAIVGARLTQRQLIKRQETVVERKKQGKLGDELE